MHALPESITALALNNPVVHVFAKQHQAGFITVEAALEGMVVELAAACDRALDVMLEAEAKRPIEIVVTMQEVPMNRVETVLVRALERDIEATLGSEGYLSLHPAVTRLGDVIWGWTGRGRGPHDRVTNAIGGLKGRTLASLIEQTRGILPPSLRALCSAVQAAHMEEDIVDAQEARRAAEGALAAKLASHGPEVYAAILAAIEEAEERGARVALEAAALGCSVMADRHQGDAKEVLREASEWIPKISLDLGLVV